MKRRTFVASGAALLLNGVVFRSSNVLGDWYSWSSSCPEGTPKLPFSPITVSTLIHSITPKNNLAFSMDDVYRQAGEFPPILIASGLSKPTDLDGWKTEIPFYEDIIIWVRANSDLDSISLYDLKSRITKRKNVFFNTDYVKYKPIREWLSHQGFVLPADVEELEAGGHGIPGYTELRRIALEVEEPIVVGLRSGRQEGFKPLAIDGMLPLMASKYPLRKPVFFYYRNQEEAEEAWIYDFEEQLKGELSADAEIYKNLGICVPE